MSCPVCLSVCLSVCPVCDVRILWPNSWMDQDGTWCVGRPRSRSHCARWGPSCPPKKGAQPPQFLAHVYCVQTAGWIKIPLDMEVGLGPDHIVLENPSSTHLKGAQPPPLFGPCLLWPYGWMGQGATWYEGRPRPRRHCVTWGSSSHPKGAQPPIFGPRLLWPNGRPPVVY